MMPFGVCMEQIKPQLDRSEPSYRDALARMYRAKPGETLHPDGVIEPFGVPLVIGPPEQIRPDPPYAKRQGYAKTRLINRERVIARLIEIGRPATASEIAQGDETLRKCVLNTRDAGVIKSRPIVFQKSFAGKRWETLYALPSMQWPALQDGRRYWEGERKKRNKK